MSSAAINDPITIHLSPEQRSELEAVAKAVSCSVPALMGEAIDAYLAQHRRDCDSINEGLRQADADEFATDEGVAAVYARHR